MHTDVKPRAGILRQVKHWLWHRAPGVRQSVLSLACSALRNTPVERCPAFWADLLEVKVPRSVRRNAVRSPAGSANIKILFELLRRTVGVPGDVAECGVYRGASLLATGLYVKQHGLGKAVLGFDSFAGFDESIAFDVQLGGEEIAAKKVGGMRETSYDAIAAKVARLGLEDIVRLNRGFFADTLAAFAGRRYSFVHLDCDIYQSYKDCLKFFYPRLSPGGVILFDEYNDPPWPGCNLAVDEFLAGKPERPTEIESDNYQKWYIRKS